MKTIEIGKHKVEFFSSIKDMPIDKYNLLQGFLMQDVGIGSTMADVDKHFRNLDIMLQTGNLEGANLERQNMQLTFYSNIEKINYKSFAFACLINSVDGKEINDLSDEGLKEVIEKLSDSLTYGFIDDLVNDLKKNCISN